MYQEIKCISAFTTATELKPYLCSEMHNNLLAMEMMQLLVQKHWVYKLLLCLKTLPLINGFLSLNH